MDTFKPDIIHLVTPFPIGLMGLKYARNNCIPIIASYHTNFPQYLKFYNLEFLENTLWYFLKWFHSYSCINLCPSWETLLLLDSKEIKNLDIWGRGIDTKRFSPGLRSEKLRCKYGGNGDIPILLYVGRLAPEKELDVLFDTVDLLNASGLNFKLLVVGDGPCRKALEERSPGNVILEAMASGLPVVAPYAGGVKENLVDMENGIAFEVGDAGSMADAAELLINNTGLRKKLSLNARKTSLLRSWDHVFYGLFEKYGGLIEEFTSTERNISA